MKSPFVRIILLESPCKVWYDNIKVLFSGEITAFGCRRIDSRDFNEKIFS